MRIWDINPGYLNRQSLLGEHRELHGIVSIIVNGKKGYSRHPETIRWNGYGWALRIRHELLAAEMSLRNFSDKSPVNTGSNKGIWPEIYIDTPGTQFNLLKNKYINKEKGRIPLPKNEQELWSHHKYSVLARDPELYKRIGRLVANKKIDYNKLSLVLVETLRIPPSEGRCRNAIQHMWGHVSDYSSIAKRRIEKWSLNILFDEIQRRAVECNESYLMSSTALSELQVWIKNA